MQIIFNEKTISMEVFVRKRHDDVDENCEISQQSNILSSVFGLFLNTYNETS